MRCPYCQQNIRVQGRFCPKCGEQIFGLPVRPQGSPPAGAPAQTPPLPTPPDAAGQGTSPRPAAPAPPPYQPFPQQQQHRDYDDGLGIEVETEPAPPVPVGDRSHTSGAPHPATGDEIGKTCPYCRFPLKPGEQVVTCPACKLPHHADCWTENRGCTTYGCRGVAASAPTPVAPMPGGPSVLSPTGGQLPGLDYLRTNELAGRANNALILAILGLFCGCLPVGVVGAFMGIAVLRDVAPMGARAGDARTKAITAIVVAAVGVIAWLALLPFLDKIQ
jgi:hypothetical protein